jgi:glutathionylspermidine synthase
MELAARAVPSTEPEAFPPGKESGFSLRAAGAIDPAAFAAIRRRALLEGCKWDPQVGDVPTLADFPLVIQRTEWRALASLAEGLAAETLAAEREVLERPELLAGLGLPRRLRAVLRGSESLTPAAARAMRFDFHATTEGWLLSEVNSDVPGGFTEASFFTVLMAERFPGLRPAGDPAARWADAIAAKAGPGGRIGLMTAPGFMEDHQVVAYLARLLRRRNCEPHLAGPRQIVWRDGRAALAAEWCRGPLAALVRFYQGEWLASLPRRCGWRCFFRGGRTPVANPGLAVIAESKRFPLLWDRLSTPLPHWRRLLPDTCDPRQAPWRTDDAWLVKSALSNTGDDVCIRELLPAREWRRTCRAARLWPSRWLAQRRFQSVAVETPRGPMHACVGVYAIDGRAAGAYARLAPRPLIDFAAVDAALLVEDDHDQRRDL